MDETKDRYLRGGWFTLAATVVILLLIYTLHAHLVVLIVVGVLGLVSGTALVVMGSRRKSS